jgi:hypothetical protein
VNRSDFKIAMLIHGWNLCEKIWWQYYLNSSFLSLGPNNTSCCFRTYSLFIVSKWLLITPLSCSKVSWFGK